MAVLDMTVGLSASGKTTYAKQLCADDPTFRRVNKDILREMRIGDEKFTHAKERDVLIMRDLLISNYLSRGFSVVVDDTNLNSIHEKTLRKLAQEHGAEFRVTSFLYVPYEECVKRDLQRDRPVGEQVIRKQWVQTLPSPPEFDLNLPTCLITDIDGTLADISHRSPYETDPLILIKDGVRQHVATTVYALHALYQDPIDVFVFSGRTDDTEAVTRQWLNAKAGFASIPYELCMRKTGDGRRDSIVKREMYEEHIKGRFNVFAVFDDRTQVLDELWYAEGVPTLNCGIGVRF